MTEISQSHGTLSSVTDDSSTPSNQSEYFSVTSSLDFLNCSDDVYYSVGEDDELDGCAAAHVLMPADFNCNHIIIENFDDFQLDLQTKMEPVIFLQPDIVYDCDNWDKVCDNLNSFLSHESMSSEEEDTNNFSTLTDSVINTFSTEKHDSDVEEIASLSVNNVNHITNSIIEGELSELNDIVYESSISQDQCANNDNDCVNDDLSLAVSEVDEEEEELRKEHNQSILELVRKIEYGELETQPSKDSDRNVINEPENTKTENSSKQLESQISEDVDKIVPCKENQRNEQHSKPKPIEMTEESPIKSSSLCCSIRRKKPKQTPPTVSVQPSKSKSLFSFLKFYKKERKPLKSPKSLPELHAPLGSKDPCLVSQETLEYNGIPFIDADVGIYSDSYIPLAIHEIFCE